MRKFTPHLTSEKLRFAVLAAYILCISGWMMYTFIRTASYYFQDTFPLNMVEGLSVYFSEQLMHGHTIYSTIYAPPFTLNLYPPVYPLISASLLYLFSPYAGHTEILRTFTLVSECLVAFLVAAIVYEKTKSRFVSVLMIPMTLGLWSVHSFHGIARLDFLALVFSLLTLLFYIRATVHRPGRSAVYFVLFALCAVCTKQTSGLIFLICSFHTVFILRKRDTRLFTMMKKNMLLVVALYGIITFILTIITHGEYFRQNFLDQLLFSFDNPYVYIVTTFIDSYGFLFIIFLLFLCKYFDPLLFLYVLFSMGWAFFSAGKAGADHNYTLELAAALLVYVGVSFGTLKKHVASWPLLVVFALCLTQAAYFINQRGFWYQDRMNEPSATERKRISQLMRNADGLILSEDPLPMLEYRKRTVTYDPFLFYVLLSRKTPEVKPLLNVLESGTVEWVFSSKFFEKSPEIQAMLRDNYTLVYSSKDFVVHHYMYVYKKNPERFPRKSR